MGSQDTHRPTSLLVAIEADRVAKQAAADEAARPEREAREQQLEADAALHGTAGWQALSPHRRQMVAAHVARQAQEAGNDAAA
ncbi:hypothetical protein [Streptomyces liliifuscus]|uniref:Uncharacterized protein n=1 Tax=Streptomyces liliifuscus TaxID=2797636 RepID=A0A7T7KY54_9ACTN|nr:hypothetical protein [Streptomyces liliifuscus]QQM42816.1 hypothetical protein JEQ17_27600 [Streptomyces liliifuscus]